VTPVALDRAIRGKLQPVSGVPLRYLARLMRRAGLTLAILGAAWTPGVAGAQEPDPGATPPPAGGPPPPPDLVVSGRNVRMTRGNVVGVRMGCRGTTAQAGEACLGSVTLRLANAIVLEPFDPPGPKPPVARRINPFDFAVRDFTLGVGDGIDLRMRLNPRAAKLVRDRERVRVDVIVRYNSRAGAAGTARRNVRVYFPRRPGV
jgi:hypothetical protein